MHNTYLVNSMTISSRLNSLEITRDGTGVRRVSSLIPWRALHGLSFISSATSSIVKSNFFPFDLLTSTWGSTFPCIYLHLLPQVLHVHVVRLFYFKFPFIYGRINWRPIHKSDVQCKSRPFLNKLRLYCLSSYSILFWCYDFRQKIPTRCYQILVRRVVWFITTRWGLFF